MEVVDPISEAVEVYAIDTDGLTTENNTFRLAAVHFLDTVPKTHLNVPTKYRIQGVLYIPPPRPRYHHRGVL